MGSDELDNIEVAIAALAVAPNVRIVLRARDDSVVAETTSLFRIGDIRDVAALTACAVARRVLGLPMGLIVGRRHDVRAIEPAAHGQLLDGPDVAADRPCNHRATLPQQSEGEQAP